MDKPGETPKLNRAERADEFARLFGRHARQVYSYILTLIPHWADAEDVFQETSAIIWEKFDQYIPGTNFRAWACQIAYYRAVWFRQRQKKLAVPFGEDFFRLVAAEMVSQGESLERRHAALAGCMERLPERDRKLVERSYAPGMTIRQAALELGRSPETTYKALKRIHRELYECVEIAMKNEE
ncbi:MAG: sigma-70 family RNA polymerase sigma factor [Pirellulales bacterium]|nr:sigma-70 family RNA polymerase sigma factor [Pirellulales bacterium]